LIEEVQLEPKPDLVEIFTTNLETSPGGELLTFEGEDAKEVGNWPLNMLYLFYRNNDYGRYSSQ
jgi:hypothetical protein